MNAARAETSAVKMVGEAASPLLGAGLFGHLAHMPSHTFVRIGRWHDAVIANLAAHGADVADAEHCQSPYEPEHNTDMLVYAANMAGEVRALAGVPSLLPHSPTMWRAISSEHDSITAVVAAWAGAGEYQLCVSDCCARIVTTCSW